MNQLFFGDNLVVLRDRLSARPGVYVRNAGVWVDSAQGAERPRHRRAGREVLDHRGLVAGMVDERGRGDVRARALQHTPEPRLVTVGRAVNARVLKGLGLVNQHRSLVPMFCQNTPTHLHDDPRGRPLARLYAEGGCFP